MAKSRNKTSSEIRHLRGQIRQLRAELKYYKRHQHHEEQDDSDDVEITELCGMDAKQCPECGDLLLIYDFHLASMKKCQGCEFKKIEKKK